MLNQTYDFVVSIGEDCACAGHLNSLGIRKVSSPLDWVDGSSFVLRTELLLNEFKDYLKAEYLEKYTKKDATHPIKYMRLNPDVPKDQVHESWINTYYGIKFHHDFVFRIPFKQNIINVRDKYNRRIERFIHSINDSNRVLFCFIARHKESPRVLVECIKKLNRKYGAHKINLLYIEDDKTLGLKDIHTDYYDDVTVVHINNTPTDFTTDFTVLLGNIPIIKKVILSNIYNYRLFKFRKIFVHVLCAFIPIRSWRRKTRKKLLKI